QQARARAERRIFVAVRRAADPGDGAHIDRFDASFKLGEARDGVWGFGFCDWPAGSVARHLARSSRGRGRRAVAGHLPDDRCTVTGELGRLAWFSLIRY